MEFSVLITRTNPFRIQGLMGSISIQFFKLRFVTNPHSAASDVVLHCLARPTRLTSKSQCRKDKTNNERMKAYTIIQIGVSSI